MRKLFMILSILFVCVTLTASCIAAPSQVAATAPEKVYVVYDSDKLVVSSKYGSQYLWIRFNSCGPNNIFAISGLYVSKYEVPDFNKSYTTLETSSSDWVAPYSFTDTDYPATKDQNFTGGWHSATINGKSVKTGYTNFAELYINSKAVKFGYRGYCDSAVIKVTNFLKAHNTVPIYRDALKESVTYTLSPRQIGINVTFQALDNIKIFRYYGLQTLNYYWKGKVLYNNSSSVGKTSTVSSDSGKKSVNPNVSIVTIYNSKQNEYVEMGLDRNYGLGTMDYVGDNQPCAFTESYGKSYFSLVYGKDYVMSKNSTASWSGYYKFGRN